MNQLNNSLDELPISETAKSIQRQLSEVIESSIAQSNGQIKFSEYLRQALYTPALGYYQNELQTFGERGDFVTAPEMGRLFAACIANSLVKVFSSAQRDHSILELGAGTGALAAELLNNLAEKDALPDRYMILEPSGSLQQLQQQQIAKTDPAIQSIVEWVTRLPNAFDGVILANEVVDAIPFERVCCVDQRWVLMGVSQLNGEFTNSLMDNEEPQYLPPELVRLMESGEVVEGYTTEYRPQAKAWLKSLTDSLNSGAILLVDYGYTASEYYHPQRASGTLSCFIRHHQHDNPFRFIGLQDITAHVDFTALARAAVDCNLDVSGFTSQAGFLLENGVAELAESQAKRLSDEQRYQLSQQMQKLLMPGQMGEVIKAILLTKPKQPCSAGLECDLKGRIKGFSLQDHLHRL
jgi:SAM-dependent MidA family methyltransferase